MQQFRIGGSGMPKRREMLKRSAQLGATFALPLRPLLGRVSQQDGVEVNDVQSQLNATRVNRIIKPNSVDDIKAALADARKEGRAVSVAGGRHAMGGQQFGRDTLLLDMKAFNRVLRFDQIKGQITAEGGIEWPELVDYLNRVQAGQPRHWTIREKQTGVDRVSLGGSLASNVHGRGLRFPPIVSDVESFDLLGADGKLRTCSRRENTELFALAIGGYGLFGVIAHVTLRLVPRTKLERVVEVIAVKDLLAWVEKRLQQGFEYGDCQYSTELETDEQAHAGVFSCYRPVNQDTPIPENQKQLSTKDWLALYTLARTDKKEAFRRYSTYYLSTSGQIYWSDLHQMAGNFDDYRKAVDVRRGTEMITEVYVRRDVLIPFLARCRKDFLEHNVDMTYGTIRFIRRDAETFLAWAKEPCVCIVCNLHVVHTEEGKKKAAEDFRRIIDRAIEFGGRYYLTYHRWATRKQVETCYPQFVEFLRLKKKYDPSERFQSDWYRHYKEMFADRL
jgi:FAD/FMN-containing dehydrogenase